MELIIRYMNALTSRARSGWYRLRGMQMDGPCWLRAIRVPRFANRIKLERGVALDDGVVLIVAEAGSEALQIQIGRSSYINRYTILDASESIVVGKHCMIGPHCYITDHNHSFGPGMLPAEGPLQSAATTIGNRCWLGAHVTVLKGVTIGEGTVVGAGSVVTKSLPPNIVAVGNPARILRSLDA